MCPGGVLARVLCWVRKLAPVVLLVIMNLIIMGAGHVGTPCVAHTQIPDPRAASGVHEVCECRVRSHVVCSERSGTVRHSVQGVVAALPKPEGPDASRGPALQADLADESSLGPAVSALPSVDPPPGSGPACGVWLLEPGFRGCAASAGTFLER